MISVEALSFTYSEGEFSLSVPELQIARGEKVAITGPSGTGKTTLLNLLAGILVPSDGRIEIDALEISELPTEDRQDLRALKMGLVFQEFELLDYLDVLDNVLLPFRISPVLELDAKVVENAEELISGVGLEGKLERFPAQLSQGERQRTAVCRALVTRPAIIFGDEPTGNLDPANRDQVMKILFDYSTEQGAPLVVVTHDRELLERFDRRVDVLEFAK
jgi:putative ABC transport system ATP-binding protein